MNSDVKTVTAQIYQFPHRAAKAPADLPVVLAKIVYGNCWYHDDAIQSEPDHVTTKPIKPLNSKPGR
jgi:Protein of unknown function (DUF2735)